MTLAELKEKIDALACGRSWWLRMNSPGGGVVLGELLVEGRVLGEAVAGDLEGAVLGLLTSTKARRRRRRRARG